MSPLPNPRKRRNRITLIEILLVMTLMALVMGTLQFGIGGMIKEQAFVQKVSQIKEVIALAEELMIDTRADLILTLHHREGTLFTELHSTKGLPSKLTALVAKIHCDKVDQLSFDGKTTKELLLYFDGHLGRMSKGEILIEGRGKKERIVLQGYPGRIT